MSLRVSPGVRLSREAAIATMIRVVEVAFFTFAQREAIFTSGDEGTHGRGSEHYVGHALDWRTRDLTLEVAQALRDDIADRLGPDFDIILEANPAHLHTEWDPK